MDKLPISIADNLITVIKSLAKNPRPYGYKRLRGRDGYRIRKGDYRILYDIYDKLLVVEGIAIGHRKRNL